MNRSVVAVIDQGVLLDRFADKSGLISEVAIYESANETDQQDSFETRLHGTNIVSVIWQVAPDTEILSVRMVPLKVANVPLLCKALRYCAMQPQIRIINISLGILSDTPSPELQECCLVCYRQGKLLVAAAHQDGEKKCYPAAFPFVYGVGVGLIKHINEYCYTGDTYINILAKGIHQRLLGEQGKPIIRGGTSYAAAAFSGILSRKIADKGILIENEIQATSIDALSFHYPHKEKYEYTSRKTPITEARGTGKWMSYAYDVTTLTSQPVLYQMDPLIDTNVIRGKMPNIPHLKPILSKKLFQTIDTLLTGNFFTDQYLLNIYFGYVLINFFIEHQGNFVVFDERIAGIIKKCVALSKTNYNGQIVLVTEEETTLNEMPC